ncbi:MAG: DUF6282 family protein [Candidatus Bathyarchaeia archaeon]
MKALKDGEGSVFFTDEVKKLLQGSIDLHVHCEPATFPMSTSAIECARVAKDLGMRAFVLKDLFFPSAGLAFLVSEVVKDVEVYGYFIINSALGETVNLLSLQQAVEYGGRVSGIFRKFTKIVSMPTFSSVANVNYYRGLAKLFPERVSSWVQLMVKMNPIPVVENGEVVAEVKDVLDVVAEKDLAVSTGHLGMDEIVPLIDEAKSRGIDRIIVNHPEDLILQITIDEQKRLAKMGAYILHCYVQCTSYYQQKYGSLIEPGYIAEAIRQAGPEHCILSTDFGCDGGLLPPPPVGMGMFIGEMIKMGISASEIELMVKKNPAEVLGVKS